MKDNEFIISYLNKNNSVGHISVPSDGRNSVIAKHKKDFNSLMDVVNFIVSHHHNDLTLLFQYNVEDVPDDNDELQPPAFYPDFTCHVCTSSLESKKKLQQHLRSHQMFFCDDCGKVLLVSSHTSHKVTCQRRAEFLCDRCNFTSIHKKNLERHLSNHPPEICRVCRSAFRTKELLQNHMFKEHNVEYKCD